MGNLEPSGSNAPAKRLKRNKKEAMIGGVCAGLAAHFDVDPTMVRILFALAFFGAGIGLIPYVLLWIIVPADE